MLLLFGVSLFVVGLPAQVIGQASRMKKIQLREEEHLRPPLRSGGHNALPPKMHNFRCAFFRPSSLGYPIGALWTRLHAQQNQAAEAEQKALKS